jgi:hypothetical protein
MNEYILYKYLDFVSISLYSIIVDIRFAAVPGWVEKL